MNARVRNGEIKGNHLRYVLGSKWRSALLSKSARKRKREPTVKRKEETPAGGTPLENAWNK